MGSLGLNITARIGARSLLLYLCLVCLHLNKYLEFQPIFQLNRGGTKDRMGVGGSVKKTYTHSGIIFQSFPYLTDISINIILLILIQ